MGPTTRRDSSTRRARCASRQRTDANVGAGTQAGGMVVVGVTTGGRVEVLVAGNEVLVDVVVGGASDEVEVDAIVLVDTSGAVVLVTEVVVVDDSGPVEVVTDDDVLELLEVADTELEVVLAGTVLALLLVVVLDDEVGGTVLVAGVDVLVGTVDVLVDTTVLEVGAAVEVVVVLVVVTAVLAVVAEVEVDGGSVVSEVLLVVLVVVVVNVPAKPPIWITLSAGLPPKVVTKRSSPVRASNSSPSGPTPSSVANTRSSGDVVPSAGTPDWASMGRPLAASMARMRSCPSSKFA